tara:strand:+ start:2868 stop:3086 length:219 start_codon:yes stop_codon:yes gene_type:complete
MKKRVTKTHRIKEHLRKRGKITSWDAFTRYGATRLSAIIFELRQKGWDIETVRKPNKDGGTYGEYTYTEDIG